MPFLSIEFSLFFLLFFPLYWAFRYSPQIQNNLLTIAGLGWLYYLSIEFLIYIIFFSTVISITGTLISQAKSKKRKFYFIAGILFSLSSLIFFKYVDFFRPAIQEIFGESDKIIDILMPLGLSYYTFQSISYLVSIYRDEEIQLNWKDLLFHFSFMPTITSGPIIRANSFKSINNIEQGAAEQIKTTTPRQMIRPALAFSLILLGIMKKWWWAGILANNFVNPVFENPMQYDLLSLLAAIYGYTAQLFFDFSGYSDLVIGLAMLLGFQLPLNFLMPLRAFNIRDFWDRWHISLSTWIRDYIYIPLGGSRKGFIRTQINLLLAMLLSGIWHGSGWNFLIWGAIHGCALVLLNLGDKFMGQRESLARHWFGRGIGIMTTLTIVVASFVIFGTSSLESAQQIFQALWQNKQFIEINPNVILLLSLLLVGLVFYPIINKLFNRFVCFLEILPIYLWCIPALIILVIIMVMAPSGIPNFIYANF